MIELKAKDNVFPVCSSCSETIREIWFHEIRGFLGRRFVYFCLHCKKVLGVTHRKGFLWVDPSWRPCRRILEIDKEPVADLLEPSCSRASVSTSIWLEPPGCPTLYVVRVIRTEEPIR
jgi:hypothetical protein